MRDDETMDRRGRLFAQHGGEFWPELLHAGVDEHDAFIGVERGDAAELRLETGSLGDLDRSALPIESRFVAAAPSMCLNRSLLLTSGPSRDF